MTIFSFVPVLLTALIGLLVYRYRNRIGFSVVGVEGIIPDTNPEIKVSHYSNRVYAERLHIKNYGLRDLENVELHFAMPFEPASSAIAQPTTISNKSISTGWSVKGRTMKIPSLPSKEELKIDFVRIGFYEPVEGRLRGTGGKYKIVRMERHEAIRGLTGYLIFILLASIAPIVGLWLDNRAASQQPVPQQVSPTDSSGKPLAAASTKG